MARPVPSKGMALVQIGYDKFVLPMRDAASIMAALENAEPYDTDGYGEDKLIYIGGRRTPRFEVEMLSEPDYLQGKFAGPKPNQD
jgi:hypothetical protein